ncbi:hypothetical protein INR49_014263 [Caranx melampygus]|nr:hypothetical protein INR49_014263 [Caranx melampygus]
MVRRWLTEPLQLDYTFTLMEPCWISVVDEVAHTLTENRVLQNSKHPFLTGSRIGGCADSGRALLATCELQLPEKRSPRHLQPRQQRAEGDIRGRYHGNRVAGELLYGVRARQCYRLFCSKQ